MTTSATRVDVEDAINVLFQVWQDTENADQILTDAAATIGHRVFHLEGDALQAFICRCKL